MGVKGGGGGGGPCANAEPTIINIIMNKAVLRYLLAIELISFNFNNEYIHFMLQIYKKVINNNVSFEKNLRLVKLILIKHLYSHLT